MVACDQPLGSRLMLLFGRSEASVWRIKLAVPRPAPHHLVDVGCWSPILQQRWAGTMGQFDSLCIIDKHVRQYSTSCANSIDFDRGIVDTELAGPPCALTISTSRPTPLYILFFYPLLNVSISLRSPGLLFC